jgi:hypothetical protein
MILYIFALFVIFLAKIYKKNNFKKFQLTNEI